MDEKKQEPLYRQDEAPPPLYQAEQEPPSANPQYPPQPYHTQAPSRTLQFDFTGWSGKHIHVTEDGPGTTVLYTADTHMLKPHLTFKSGSAGSSIGTASYRTFRRRMEIRLHDQDIILRITSLLMRDLTFESPALQNALLTWKRRSAIKLFDYECLDANAVPIARFKIPTSWNVKKVGFLEFFGSAASDNALAEEIIVTGLTMAYFTLIQASAGAAAAA